MATKIERLAEVQRKRLMVSSLPTTFALALFTNIYIIWSVYYYIDYIYIHTQYTTIDTLHRYIEEGCMYLYRMIQPLSLICLASQELQEGQAALDAAVQALREGQADRAVAALRRQLEVPTEAVGEAREASRSCFSIVFPSFSYVLHVNCWARAAVAAGMKLLASAIYLGCALKVPDGFLEVDVRRRGHARPTFAPPLGPFSSFLSLFKSLEPRLGSAIYPVAPEDALTAGKSLRELVLDVGGVEAAALRAPPGSSSPRYQRREALAPSSFPESTGKAGSSLRLIGSQVCHGFVAMAQVIFLSGLLLLNGARSCGPGDAVRAYFAGDLDLGEGPEQCDPSMPDCWFPGVISQGPLATGSYLVAWPDGTASAVHARQVFQGGACDEGTALTPAAGPSVLLRLHWEASEELWRQRATRAIGEELGPESMVSDFEWHLILRYSDERSCKQAVDSLKQSLLQPYGHPYVRSLEYESCGQEL